VAIVQNEGVDLATLLQNMLNFFKDMSNLMIAIFTFFLWRVSEKQAKIAKEQAEIADRQTQIQQSLAKLETEPLIFLEFTKKKLWEGADLNIVNMGRYGCLILEAAVMPPGWEKPEDEAPEREIVLQNVPVLAGERKQITRLYSISEILGRHSDEWLNKFVRKRELEGEFGEFGRGEFFVKVSYYYGGKPEEIRHDFFRIAFSIIQITHFSSKVTSKVAKIENVEIAYRNSYHSYHA